MDDCTLLSSVGTTPLVSGCAKTSTHTLEAAPHGVKLSSIVAIVEFIGADPNIGSLFHGVMLMEPMQCGSVKCQLIYYKSEFYQ